VPAPAPLSSNNKKKSDRNLAKQIFSIPVPPPCRPPMKALYACTHACTTSAGGQGCQGFDCQTCKPLSGPSRALGPVGSAPPPSSRPAAKRCSNATRRRWHVHHPQFYLQPNRGNRCLRQHCLISKTNAQKQKKGVQGTWQPGQAPMGCQMKSLVRCTPTHQAEGIPHNARGSCVPAAVARGCPYPRGAVRRGMHGPMTNTI
jgi:hypothetical protein